MEDHSPGDILHVESEIVEITPSRSKPHQGIITGFVLRKLKEEDGPSARLKIGHFSGSDSEQVANEPHCATDLSFATHLTLPSESC